MKESQALAFSRQIRTFEAEAYHQVGWKIGLTHKVNLKMYVHHKILVFYTLLYNLPPYSEFPGTVGRLQNSEYLTNAEEIGPTKQLCPRLNLKSSWTSWTSRPALSFTLQTWRSYITTLNFSVLTAHKDNAYLIDPYEDQK